jgi:hypothetical protein
MILIASETPVNQQTYAISFAQSVELGAELILFIRYTVKISQELCFAELIQSCGGAGGSLAQDSSV